MGRFLAGVASALLFAGAGIFWWSSGDASADPIPAAPVAAAAGIGGDEDPPQASAATREQRRFSRYDKDKDGRIVRDEYLASRRKAFAKLDRDGDGRLSFEEYAVKAGEKFAKADADKSGVLDAAEFATTRVIRKAPARPNCPPPPAADAGDEG
ncbi:EF-hand domain-containing protein [Sphingomonas sp. KC8]|uniref:EF-hand domain-containing protein n=1 Tax=Sphingomonas sp. KC8 TaxID=1030157 RepID=UPI000248AB1C|nr:EF-hand domain-containing protein [Sphingomonas sp. KC8]ARS28816.1 histidine kinase [Sphingomonas sp. KC8]